MVKAKFKSVFNPHLEEYLVFGKGDEERSINAIRVYTRKHGRLNVLYDIPVRIIRAVAEKKGLDAIHFTIDPYAQDENVYVYRDILHVPFDEAGVKSKVTPCNKDSVGLGLWEDVRFGMFKEKLKFSVYRACPALDDKRMEIAKLLERMRLRSDVARNFDDDSFQKDIKALQDMLNDLEATRRKYTALDDNTFVERLETEIAKADHPTAYVYPFEER